ncbi:MAG: sialate O-acetylesterase [Thermoflavifilum sp.]|nr:sialate O-acetylesterase [Thermoflavifilum sp.]
MRMIPPICNNSSAYHRKWWIFILAICCFHLSVAQIHLPRIISDGMVLQRNDTVRIWGWASPHESIQLVFLNEVYHTKADERGNWMIKLLPAPAGGPYSMEIDGNNHITLHDIYIGDVWLCSGQSNMQLPMSRVQQKYAHLIAHIDQPAIRQFLVPMQMNFNHPEQDFPSGNWEPANCWTVLHFSATAYFFARALYEKYHVPIGLINASVGGTPIEAWMSKEALKDFPEALRIANHYADAHFMDSVIKNNNTLNREWYSQAWTTDTGWNARPPWFKSLPNLHDWSSVQVPGYWNHEPLHDVHGIIWLKKTFYLSTEQWKRLQAQKEPAKLILGRLIDADYTYLNGVFVGNITYQYPPRIYACSPSLFKPGENEITVRLFHSSGSPIGFVPDKLYACIWGHDTISLTGEWKYKLGVKMPVLPDQVFIQYQPTGLFNGMIAPLLPYTIRGAIWYQGESNTAHPENYASLFKRMIQDWRAKWQEGDFPFLFVQLPNYGFPARDPNQWSGWALLREAQTQALQLPYTGMAVTIDIGEWNDVHPLDKQDVGNRLALAAEKVAYGASNTSPGPICVSMQVKNHRAVLRFTHVGKGLMVKGNAPLQEFQLAGSDHHFVYARAKIISPNEVMVWSDEIQDPQIVRYAWSDSPIHPNLYNSEGLPAAPFRIQLKPE